MGNEAKPDVPGPLIGGPTPMAPRSRRRASWWRRTWHALVAPVAVILVRSIWGTYRYVVTGEDAVNRLVSDGEPLIFTFWHEHIFAVAPYLFRLGRRGARITFLVSPSVDGDLVVRILDILGGRAVRGSATRSGVKAMKGLYRAIVRERGSPVVLPDGPQGPRHHCKPGSLLLAQMSGARILPMACTASPAWRLRTWDRIVLPLPFAEVRVVLGDSYTVPTGMSSDELEEARQELEERLGDLRPESSAGGSAE
jgi:lysophospholipid acyltransferase (LPLAT)-like uncharacterized protein